MTFMLTTRRLVLEDLTLLDFDDLLRMAQDERVMQYLMVWLENEDQVNAFVQHAIDESQRSDRADYLLAIRIAKTGEFAGVTFIEIDPREPSTAEIGCILLPDFWKAGYATEILRTLLAFSFDVLRLHRVYGKCDEQNTPSARSLENGGLKYEGTLREHVWLRDHWRSTKYYGMLAEEYFQRPRTAEE